MSNPLNLSSTGFSFGSPGLNKLGSGSIGGGFGGGGGLGTTTSTSTTTGGFSLGGTTGSTGFGLPSVGSQPALSTLSTSVAQQQPQATLGSLTIPAATSTSAISTPAASTLATTSTTSSSSSSAAAAATTTTQATPQPANAIAFKVVDDYINKWMSELEVHEKDFLNQATQLNALDKLMIDNGEKIIDASVDLNRLSSEQDELEQELNFVHSQQNDLDQAISRLELGIEQMPIVNVQQQQFVQNDSCRIEMYKLLMELDNQLRSTSIDLRDIVKRLNETSANLNDPMVQINKILNAHMDSLNWIEENTNVIQNQVENLSKDLDERMRL